MTVTEESITPGSVGDYIMEVAPYTPGAAPATEAWVRVRGITEITPPTTEKNLEDDGEINGDVWGSQIATGVSWSAEGKCKTPRGTLPKDPGQQIMADAEFGIAESGLVWVRHTLPTGDGREGTQGLANCEWKVQGGSRTDFTTADYAFTGRGRLDRITVDGTGEVTVEPPA